MKAKYYYEKYGEGIASADDEIFKNSLTDMFSELSDEIKEIVKIRNVKTVSGAMSIVKEINQKYNAICSLYNKAGASSPIRRNGFLILWLRTHPEYKTFIGV